MDIKMNKEVEELLNDLENDINAISIESYTGGYKDKRNAIETLAKLKLKLSNISENAEPQNGGNTCNHKWVQLWSGDPDSQSMEFEGEKCRLCGSDDYPV